MGSVAVGVDAIEAVVLQLDDVAVQDLLWEYAERQNERPEYANKLKASLQAHGYVPPEKPPTKLSHAAQDALRSLVRKSPQPRGRYNPAMMRRLLKDGLVETTPLAPGSNVPHVQVSEAGKDVVARLD